MSEAIERVGVVGAGLMGAGIAEVAAKMGSSVLVCGRVASGFIIGQRPMSVNRSSAQFRPAPSATISSVPPAMGVHAPGSAANSARTALSEPGATSSYSETFALICAPRQSLLVLLPVEAPGSHASLRQ